MKAKVKLTRTVTEIAIVKLDRDKNVEEVLEVCEEIDYDDIEIHSIISAIN